MRQRRPGGGGRTQLLHASGHFTFVDHASLPRRNAVPTPNKRHLQRLRPTRCYGFFFHILHENVFTMYLIPFLFLLLGRPSIISLGSRSFSRCYLVSSVLNFSTEREGQKKKQKKNAATTNSPWRWQKVVPSRTGCRRSACPLRPAWTRRRAWSPDGITPQKHYKKSWNTKRYQVYELVAFG